MSIFSCKLLKGFIKNVQTLQILLFTSIFIITNRDILCSTRSVRKSKRSVISSKKHFYCKFYEIYNL